MYLNVQRRILHYSSKLGATQKSTAEWIHFSIFIIEQNSYVSTKIKEVQLQNNIILSETGQTPKRYLFSYRKIENKQNQSVMLEIEMAFIFGGVSMNCDWQWVKKTPFGLLLMFHYMNAKIHQVNTEGVHTIIYTCNYQLKSYSFSRKEV